MQHKQVQKLWGYEIWIENNIQYCGKHLCVLPNKWCSAHFHKNKKETFYVIDGELILYYSNNIDENIWSSGTYNKIILKKGESFTIEPYTVHRFSSNINKPCHFIEVSTHHDDNDSYRITPSFS
jgi:mannose-6-phosphate isomerase-like protein (cupin superfamily)